MIVLVDLISETEPNFKRANPEIAMFSLRCLLWEEKIYILYQSGNIGMSYLLK